MTIATAARPTRARARASTRPQGPRGEWAYLDFDDIVSPRTRLRVWTVVGPDGRHHVHVRGRGAPVCTCGRPAGCAHVAAVAATL